MTTLIELATEYADDPGTIEAHELQGLEEFTCGAVVYPGSTDADCIVYLTIHEPLDFHADLEESRWERLDAYAKATEVRLFEADGSSWSMTDAGWDAVQRVLAERYEATEIDLAGNILSFDICLTMPADTPVELVSGLFWEQSKVVDFINESDPGTYGSLYLFGSIMEDALKTEDA